MYLICVVEPGLIPLLFYVYNWILSLYHLILKGKEKKLKLDILGLEVRHFGVEKYIICLTPLLRCEILLEN